MADNNNNEALIPYPSNREIIIRQRDSVVVYDPESRSLVRRPHASHLDECPYCRQPLPSDGQHAADAAQAEPPSPTAAAFASPDYFRMLARSLPGIEPSPDSDQTGPPPSPLRRLTSTLDDDESSADASRRSPHGISSDAFSPNYFERFFQEEKVLGKGGKGVVLLVKHMLDGVSLGHFALKRIPVGDDHEWLKKVLIEVQLLQHLSHENLVSYCHVWLQNAKITNFGPSVPCAFVLQKYCNSGDLQNYVLRGAKTSMTKEELKERVRRRSRAADDLSETNGPRGLGFEEVVAFFKDITAGLNHLHLNNFIHRDLKPSNCLLHHTGKEIRVLVSDFGEAQMANQVRQSTGATGTISYCAPEVLRTDPVTGGFGNFSTKSDVFSLGLILYFLCLARLPYQNSDQLNEEQENVDLLRQEILAWVGIDDFTDARPDLPHVLFRFMARLLALDPADRPTAEETLQAIKVGTEMGNSTEAQQGENPRRRSRVYSTDSAFPSQSTKTKSMSQRFQTKTRTESPPSRLDLSPRRRVPENAIEEEVTSESGRDELPRSSGSLVLRSRHPSPVKSEVYTKKALPAPQPPAFYKTSEFAYTVKIASMLLKILSMYFLCQPLTARADAGILLLGLATLDLLLSEYGIKISSALLTLHFVLLWLTSRNELLCIPQNTVWHGLE